LQQQTSNIELQNRRSELDACSRTLSELDVRRGIRPQADWAFLLHIRYGEQALGETDQNPPITGFQSV
jgi:hypothetical protein